MERGVYTVILDHTVSRKYAKAYEFMNLSIQQAYLGSQVYPGFNVGSVLVLDDVVISTGYSNETGEHNHATQCVFEKLDNLTLARGASLYNTIEPCSYKLYDNDTSCTKRIIDAGISTVYIGVKEPETFSKCEGVNQLLDSGIDVYCLKMLEEACLEPNRHFLNRRYI
ncbi:hypothetical protein BB561_002086 [Smittium simulii]|uniref:CMP/dCMP-type deaminase domain-containing protein n=1 Tax=Smittium simulii TaxID=133385 RepID=A0A2T9YRR3_9FUNG|nr:hypothetical protein BB561_002086 [Smittium simulii]